MKKKKSMHNAAYMAWTIAATILFATLLSANESNADRKLVMKIDNMTCSMCPINVRKAVQKLDGIGDVQVTRTPPQAVVKYNSKVIDKDRIAKASTDTGYPATILSDQAIGR